VFRDHDDIVTHRTETIKQNDGTDLSLEQEYGVLPPFRVIENLARDHSKTLEGFLQQRTPATNIDQIVARLAFYASHGLEDDIEEFLNQAAQEWHSQDIRDILNTRNQHRMTILMVAASQGLTHTVRLLLELGADPNFVPWTGMPTALDLAADAGYFFIAQMLISAGADVTKAPTFVRIVSNPKEYVGENTTPQADKQSLSRLLHRMNLNTLTPLQRSAWEGDIKQLEALLTQSESGTSTYTVEEGASVGCSPFLLVSTGNHFEVMELRDRPRW
jgi:hypothetical protein